MVINETIVNLNILNGNNEKSIIVSKSLTNGFVATAISTIESIDKLNKEPYNGNIINKLVIIASTLATTVPVNKPMIADFFVLLF